ncbi:YdcF family protein [Arcicella aquatica]|uniref:YdcF family protein n=1 Tax=Arcicella aquatica TaxID=217141 RepID=A0ABU5QI82_9BACT|nr:YdcF family protein [Arcicella aquatica]MEA5256757.1 YdcF family protein [Arcicella aquatica]
MNGLLIIMADANTYDGNLSPIAIDRVLGASKFLKNNPEFYVLCTGGFGSHFNTSEYPHAQHLQNFLLEEGIAHDRFIEFSLGETAIEDIQLCHRIINRYEPDMVAVITSDYQVERIRFTFQKYSDYQFFFFLEVKSNLYEEEMERLVRLEQQALNRLRFLP